eukprot:2196779-Rhodomonas_salina.1
MCKQFPEGPRTGISGLWGMAADSRGRRVRSFRLFFGGVAVASQGMGYVAEGDGGAFVLKELVAAGKVEAADVRKEGPARRRRGPG